MLFLLDYRRFADGPRGAVLCESRRVGGTTKRRATDARPPPVWRRMGPVADYPIALLTSGRLEAPPGFEPGMELLQSSALPLGYGAARIVLGVTRSHSDRMATFAGHRPWRE